MMNRVNLMSESDQQARRRRYHVRRWAAAVLVTLGAVLVAGGVEWYRQFRVAELLERNEHLLQELSGVRAEVLTLTEETQRAQRHLERAAALRAKRAWSGLFARVGSCMPEACWLVALTTEPGEPAAARGAKALRPPSAHAAGIETTVEIDAPHKLRLDGYARDAADPHAFVTNLKASELFTRVALEHLEREAVLDGSYFRFELICEW